MPCTDAAGIFAAPHQKDGLNKSIRSGGNAFIKKSGKLNPKKQGTVSGAFGDAESGASGTCYKKTEITL